MADASLDIVVKVQDQTNVTLKQIESGIIRFVGSISAALAAIRVVTFPIQNATEFQRLLLEVARTTEFSQKQIDELSRSLIEMSKNVNIGTEELAKIAISAGQLGVGQAGVKTLAAFTETTARFSTVLDVAADKAADSIGKILNIFQLGFDQAERVSSTLAKLAAESTASGADLIDIIQRIGTAGSTLNFPQAAALAAFGRDMGLTLETIGTSFNKVFLDLQTKSQEVATLIGVPVEQFTNTIKKDGIEALQQYLAALSKLPEAQRAATAEKITGGGRIFNLVTNAVRDIARGEESLLSSHLRKAEEAFAKGTEAITQQQRTLAGLAAQYQILKNVIFALSEEIGRRALPFLTELARRLQEGLQNRRVVDTLQNAATAVGNFGVKLVEAITAVVSNGQAMSALGETIKLIYNIILGILSPLAALADFFTQNKVALTALVIAVQGLLVLKVASFFLGIGNSIAGAISRVAELAKGFTALATGAAAAGAGAQQAAQKVATAAQAAANQVARTGTQQQTQAAQQAAQAAASQVQKIQLPQQLAQVGSAIGAIFGPQIQAKRAITEAAKELTRIERDQLVNAAQLNALNAQRQRDLVAILARENQIKADRAAGLITARQEAARLQVAALDRQAVRVNTAPSQQQIDQFGILRRQRAEQEAILQTNRQVLVTQNAQNNVLGKLNGALALGGTLAAGIGRAFGFLLGPVGQIVTTVTLLLDAFGLLDPLLSGLGRVFGFVSEQVSAQEKASREQLSAIRKSNEEAEAGAVVYDEMLKKQKSIVLAVRESTKEADKFKEGISQALVVMDRSRDKFQATVVAGSRTERGIDLLNTKRQELQKTFFQLSSEIAKLDEKIENSRKARLFPDADRLIFGGSSTQTLVDKRADLEKQASGVTAELDRINKATKVSERNLIELQNQGQLALASFGNATIKLLESFDIGGLRLTQQLEDAVRAQEELKKAQGRLQQLEAQGADRPEASAKDRQAFLEQQGIVDELTAKVKTAELAFDSMFKNASAGAIRFFNALAPQGAATPLKALTDQNRVVALSIGERSAAEAKASAEVQKELDAQIAKLKELEGRIKAVRNPTVDADTVALGGSGPLVAGNAEKFAASLEREAAAMRSQIDQRKNFLQQEKQIQEAAAQALEASQATQRSEFDKTRDAVARYLRAFAQTEFVNKQIEAQTQLAKSARTSATQFAEEWKKAQDDLFKLPVETAKRAATMSNIIRDAIRANAAEARRVIDQGQRDLANISRNLLRDKAVEQVRNLGLDPDAEKVAVALIERQIELQRKEAEAIRDRNLARKEGEDIQAEASVLTDKVARGQQEITDLVKAREQALKNGDLDIAKRLEVEIQAKQQQIEEIFERLKRLNEEFAKIAAKTFPTELNPNPEPIFKREDIQRQEEALERMRRVIIELRTDVAKANTDAAEGLAKQQENKLETLKTQATDLKKVVDEAKKTFADLGDAKGFTQLFENMGKTINEQALASNSPLAQFIDRLGKVGINPDKFRFDLTQVKPELDAVAAQIDNLAKNLATATAAQAPKNLREAIESAARLAGDIIIPIRHNDAVFAGGIEKFFQDRIFDIKVKPVLQPDGTLTGVVSGQTPLFRAQGGLITGPGTETSDSIPAYLSKNEYVSDAKTVRFFGTPFFIMLKAIARGTGTLAKTAVSQFGYQIPTYAGGGPARFPTPEPLQTATTDGPFSIVRVDIRGLGSSPVEVTTDRKSAQSLIRALKSLDRVR